MVRKSSHNHSCVQLYFVMLEGIYREVVAHKVPDAALLGAPLRRASVELDGKAAGVPDPLRAARGYAHDGEAHHDRRPLADAGEDAGVGQICDVICDLHARADV